ncbi:MAG: hypothetical protein ABNH53_08765 [Henriciella sp.]|jgi:hypothetical protein
MKKLKFAALAAALSAMVIAPAAMAQGAPPIPNTGGMPAACPAMDDVVDALKLAERSEVILRLRKDAEATQNQQCKQYINIIEGGLSAALLAVTSQSQTKVCQAYSQPEVKSALAATFLVGVMFKSAPCSAFK